MSRVNNIPLTRYVIVFVQLKHPKAVEQWIRDQNTF